MPDEGIKSFARSSLEPRIRKRCKFESIKLKLNPLNDGQVLLPDLSKIATSLKNTPELNEEVSFKYSSNKLIKKTECRRPFLNSIDGCPFEKEAQVKDHSLSFLSTNYKSPKWHEGRKINIRSKKSSNEVRRCTLDSDPLHKIKEFLHSQSTILLNSPNKRIKKRRCLPKMKIRMSSIMANTCLKPSDNITFNAKMKKFQIEE